MEQVFNVLFEHIADKVPITERDKEVVMSFFRRKKLRKRQYLLQEGDVCKYISFVTEGLMRSYTVDEKGNEHINLFAWEGWWISDFAGFIFGNEAKLNIDAIEDTTVLLLSVENYEKMLTEVPLMERYFRVLYQNSLATKDSRLISAITHTAEEKYTMFLDTYPSIGQRLPQNLIASYLGLSPETISRIKKKITETNT
ncbi:Crp/Fnr family transcriptional regulator [Sphingobacterium deserti]|uniref:Putative transcriptional regulator, Crp/Fnr family n=1 Tax=Sphingobacterium deserti TaxID=1229276 RepID=A0A0B8TBI8_9SPHI|nr:Crp/Fnr family transcriptional regulator [Sphingobacterium deserti]KGE15575.1 putative transcriptional regulator, Crp/Fnr family [Sphingobacterium deserti]